MSLENLDDILKEEEPQPRTFPTGAVAAVVVVALVVWGCIGLAGLFVAPVVASVGNVSSFATDTDLQSATFAIERYMISMEYGDIDRASTLLTTFPTPTEYTRLSEQAERPAFSQRVEGVTIRTVGGIPVSDSRLNTFDANNPLFGSDPIDFEGTLTYADGTERGFLFRMVRDDTLTAVASDWLIERAFINE